MYPGWCSRAGYREGAIPGTNPAGVSTGLFHQIYTNLQSNGRMNRFDLEYTKFDGTDLDLTLDLTLDWSWI